MPTAMITGRGKFENDLYGLSTYGTGVSGGLQGDKELVRSSAVECCVGALVVMEEHVAGQGRGWYVPHSRCSGAAWAAAHAAGCAAPHRTPRSWP